MFPKIKDGAIFISDAHANGNREDFFRFLLFLKKGGLNPPQLFLVGDIFDLLSFKIDYTKKFFFREIKLLRRLSKRMDIYFFEGNHDFVLKPLFKNIKVFPIQKQPVFFVYKDLKICISHGDVFENCFYKIYTKIIRNPFLLSFLNFFDSFGGFFLSKRILKKQSMKKPCRKIENFKIIIEKRVKRYKDCSLVIEGHYHQNAKFFIEGKSYINLPSFACDKKVFVFKNGELKELDYDKDAVFGS